MFRKITSLSIILALSVSLVFAQAQRRYTNLFSENELRSHVKFLSDDLFEGRGPGTRGGQLAAKYIAAQLESYGIKGAGKNESFFQPVSLVAIKAAADTALNVSGNGKKESFEFADDFVAFTGAQKDDVSLDADLVYVGYGIDAPEQNWNDYKGKKEDYRGKILVMMVNDPQPTAAEPNLFGGKALTYYGRWTYKFEQAARMGAAGVLLIHTTESAGYVWNVVRTSNGSWRYDIARENESKTPFLQMRSWMTNDTAKKIFSMAGKDLDKLKQDAESRDFQPVDLNLRAKINIKSELLRVEAPNVVGIWPGSDPKLKNEYVVYTAHWDHLGIGAPDAKGDKIYNGALDNSSGCAQVLAIAKAFTKLPKAEQPKRSQVFVFTTAEEQGLLGAEWYAAHPLFPLDKTAANINIDGGNFYGLTRDYGALGAQRSSLWDVVSAVLKERKMTFLPDSHPDKGYFFRSDHFPFAKMGVPALSVQTGDDFIGKPKDWSKKFFEEYLAKNYHQPSDEFDETWRYDGMVQSIEISMAIGMRVSNLPKLPAYKAGDEFARAQPNRK